MSEFKIVEVPSADTAAERYAKERLYMLQRRYAKEAEPFLKILADEAARKPTPRMYIVPNFDRDVLERG